MSADIFQSTLPIQGETKNGREAQGRGDISIHSPYTGRDLYGFRRQDYHPAFQSTLPIQGETTFNSSPQALIQHFNPLSLYRERLLQYLVRERALLFQSTLPIQGETMGQRWTDGWADSISIHSPYTGRDTTISDTMRIEMYFNPLSLYRERRSLSSITSSSATFQSTLPIQGETKRTGTG